MCFLKFRFPLWLGDHGRYPAEAMTYAVTSEITRYLPPESIDARPLDYEWVEATNAIVFVSTFAHTSFALWETKLSVFYRMLIGDGCGLTTESHSELGCISFWFDSNPNVDVHVARCENINSVENLDSWLGSPLLVSMAMDPRAATVGIIRIWPD